MRLLGCAESRRGTFRQGVLVHAAGAPAALAIAAALLGVATAASAVIIASGDGTGNTTAPSPDPGWNNVGIVYHAYAGVYVGGNGWVLTANHVGPGTFTLGGVDYAWAPGTAIQLKNPDNTLADLVMFHLQPPYPALSDVSIPTSTPAMGTALILIGNGHDRGAATSWIDPADPNQCVRNGWSWAATTRMRWGTNFVENVNAAYFQSKLGTHLFGSVFDLPGDPPQCATGNQISTNEAEAAQGDSGGAVFASNGAGYDLAGILLYIATYQNQPGETALDGNYTLAGDLSVYHDQIVATMPEPAGGLWVGAALVAALRLRSTARRPNRSGPRTP